MRRRRWLVGAVVLIAVAAAGGWAWQQHQYKKLVAALLAKPLPAGMTMRVVPGSSLTQIAQTAVDSGVPLSRGEFILLARYLQVDKKLQAGVYRPAGTVEQAILAIARGRVSHEKITFVEGIRFADMRAQLMADKRLRDVLVTMTAADIKTALAIEHEHLEGLFLPDTYFFSEGDSDFSVLQRAHRALKTMLMKQWESRSDSYFTDPYDALILASVVEKETGKGEERPLIASVFLNRLHKKIRLQADPTVIYGLGDAFDGNLTRKHLRGKDNPYNTYVHGGLPPTPIALVGEAAVVAALNPAQTDYFYFVATGDGGHYFSKTLREHNNAVNKYQRRRKK